MTYSREDKLDRMIALAVVGCGDDDVEMFNQLDDSSVVFSPRHTKEYNRIIAAYKRKPTVVKLKRIFFRLSVAIIAVLAAAFLTIMSISALRNAVWKVITEWYKDYIAISYEKPDSTNDVAAEIPGKIEQVRKPAYLPDGTEEEIIMQSDIIVSIDYYIGDNWHCSYSQTLLDEDEIQVDNDGAIIEEIEINGNTATLIYSTDKPDKSIIWNDGQYIYSVIADCEVDDLIRIAESVR